MTPDPPAWVRDAVFYQVFPDRFAASVRVPKPGPLEPWDAPPTHHGFKGGDLLGIAERLPYLAKLGVTVLYLTPIFASASNHRYHTYDYFAVDPLLGGNDGLRELTDAAHARGMRLILDGVFNHTGRGFWPFHHVLESGAASPYRNWFHFDDGRLAAGRPVVAYPEAIPPGVALDEPPFADRREEPGDRSLHRLGYRAWWDLPALPKLNTDEPAVREYIFGVAEHWLRFGIDGWRLDVPEEIADPAFWAEFRRRCRAVDPEAYLVGEIWHRAPDWLAGDRFDALMNYPLAEAILSFVAAGRLDERMLAFHHEYRANVSPIDGPAFARRIEEIMGWYSPAVTLSQLNLLGSHDTPRFVTFASADRASYRLAVLLQATLPGAPCVYYGDEIGMEGGPDPDCRRAFPPDEADWDADILAFVRAAFALRHARPELRRGSLRVLGAGGGAVVFLRSGGDGSATLVTLNAGDAAVRLTVQARELAGRSLVPAALPGWIPPTVALGDGASVELSLAARSGSVLLAG